jgi:hypothetical protein
MISHHSTLSACIDPAICCSHLGTVRCSSRNQHRSVIYDEYDNLMGITLDLFQASALGIEVRKTGGGVGPSISGDVPAFVRPVMVPPVPLMRNRGAT